MKKVKLLPTRDCEAGYGPVLRFVNPKIRSGNKIVFVYPDMGISYTQDGIIPKAL